MIQFVRGALAAMVILAGTAACSPNADEVKATITTIDRSCDFVETEYDPATHKAMTARGYTDSCGSTDEFEKIKQKRNKVVSGRATVHVSYAAPTDGSYQTGEFEMTGRDDDFYVLKAGDTVDILVSKSDPTKIRKA